jgi:hypothetical protein
MAEPPHRKRFQVHLSTAVVLMFVGAGVVWLNLTWQDDMVGGVYKMEVYPWETDYGWPLNAYEYVLGVKRLDLITTTIDVLIALILLWAVWSLCEWQIRHGAARKEG